MSRRGAILAPVWIACALALMAAVGAVFVLIELRSHWK